MTLREEADPAMTLPLGLDPWKVGLEGKFLSSSAHFNHTENSDHMESFLLINPVPGLFVLQF